MLKVPSEGSRRERAQQEAWEAALFCLFVLPSLLCDLAFSVHPLWVSSALSVSQRE